jgi:hypothetical protein
MARLAFLYYLFLFSTAGLILSLVLLADMAWLMPALMMTGIILLTNTIVIVMKWHT